MRGVRRTDRQGWHASLRRRLLQRRREELCHPVHQVRHGDVSSDLCRRAAKLLLVRVGLCVRHALAILVAGIIECSSLELGDFDAETLNNSEGF